MKSVILRAIDGVTRRAAKSLSLQARQDSFNILEVAHWRATVEFAEYYEKNLLDAQVYQNDLQQLSHALSIMPKHGLILEFGVATGRTISHIATTIESRIVYGFDSFEGLPETWRSGFDKGTFKRVAPAVPKNAELVKGWFTESLPAFLDRHREDVALLHIDCDLYSSTRTVLDLLAPRIKAGCVIVFDEYWNYPGWKAHEQKAFFEFIETTKNRYRYLSFVPSHQQVCVVIE